MDLRQSSAHRPWQRCSQQLQSNRGGRSGLAQLTLVEHALCPLDSSVSLVEHFVHETAYPYTDPRGHIRFAKVTITAPWGLSAKDEYFLWGLLALTFAQPQPIIEFWATPHYCLRHLGCLSRRVATSSTPATVSKGGVNYAEFRSSIKRLAGVFYQCERFYDPLRKEFRDRGFGFLKYDLPTDPASSRAWRIVWDPLFFEFCRATGGKLFFDLETYRQLDYATRRLFLLLHKIFWRHEVSPRFDVRTLAIQTLGFSPNVAMPQLKQKLGRCIARLRDVGAIRPLATGQPADLFEKKAKGSYAIRFHRGPYFERHQERATLSSAPTALGDSPLYEPLRSIGFPDARIRQILARFKRHHIELWSDVTLAKIERDGRKSFTNCPEAYFMDNIKAASETNRTPPDWYVQDRKAKDLARREDERRQDEVTISFAQYQAAWRNARSQAFKKYVEAEIGRDEYKRAVGTLSDIFSHTMPPNEALDRAIRDAERHFMSGFRFPDIATWVMEHKHELDTAA